MNQERLKMLEQYALEDPNDPFPIYALALEWVATNPAKAKALFDQLLTSHPEYLPVYYHAGQFYFNSGDAEKARQVVELGIEKTARTKDKKALAELRTLLDEIL